MQLSKCQIFQMRQKRSIHECFIVHEFDLCLCNQIGFVCLFQYFFTYCICLGLLTLGGRSQICDGGNVSSVISKSNLFALQVNAEIQSNFTTVQGITDDYLSFLWMLCTRIDNWLWLYRFLVIKKGPVILGLESKNHCTFFQLLWLMMALGKDLS